jgi:hypothetical protein
MISQLAFILIFGKPLVMYLGIVTLLLILFTAIVGSLNHKGIRIIPFKWHPVLAGLTILFAFIHGLLGLSINFNF